MDGVFLLEMKCALEGYTMNFKAIPVPCIDDFFPGQLSNHLSDILRLSYPLQPSCNVYTLRVTQ